MTNTQPRPVTRESRANNSSASSDHVDQSSSGRSTHHPRTARTTCRCAHRRHDSDRGCTHVARGFKSSRNAEALQYFPEKLSVASYLPTPCSLRSVSATVWCRSFSVIPAWGTFADIVVHVCTVGASGKVQDSVAAVLRRVRRDPDSTVWAT